MTERFNKEVFGRYLDEPPVWFGRCEFLRNPRGDYALQAVMRILFHRRIPEGKTLIVSGETDAEVHPFEMRMTPETTVCLEDIGFTENQKVSRFFAQNGLTCSVFCNAALNAAWVVGPVVTANAVHVIACAVPAIFHNLFVEMPLTECEKTMLKALGQGDKEEFIDAFFKCIDELKIERDIKHSLIEHINKAQNLAVIKRYRNQLTDVESRISDYMDELSELEKKRRDLLRSIIGANNSRQYDELFSDDNIVIESFIADDGLVYFSYKTTAWTSDVEIIENQNSYIYEEFCPHENVPLLHSLLRKIFVTREINLRMTGSFQLDLSTMRVFAREYHAFDTMNMPNPHIFQYGCLGGYVNSIAQACSDDNLEYAFELVKASSGNINFADYTVMHQFITYNILDAINGTECRCLEDKSGNKLTIKEWWENEQRNSND